jgi:hypothetical protein
MIRERSSKSRWLNRSVLGIGLASLFSDVGHEMATTAMPALLASLGASSAILGLIEGLADVYRLQRRLYSFLLCKRTLGRSFSKTMDPGNWLLHRRHSGDRIDAAR